MTCTAWLFNLPPAIHSVTHFSSRNQNSSKKFKMHKLAPSLALLIIFAFKSITSLAESRSNNAYNTKSSTTHNFSHISEATNLHNLMYIKPTGKTRSSDNLCLPILLRTFELTICYRFFRNSSPRLWNSPPTNLRSL